MEKACSIKDRYGTYNPEHPSIRLSRTLIEHLFIGELLKHSWLHDQASLEISKPELDRAGHDIILESNGITRHVQLKSSARTAKTASQKIHVDLADKPSGCVI
jgi:hypothetical protein